VHIVFGVAQMRAVVAERPDGPDGLVLREVPRPEPRPGWALVRVEAFGLNRSEYKTLKGYAGDAVTAANTSPSGPSPGGTLVHGGRR
jgi:NADPH:quinone reductase-like Zn-dependent oxidoreductase